MSVFDFMKWKKANSEKMALFDSLLPDNPRLEKRKLFGYPCAFTNGNMFCGMHGDHIVVRLPQARRDELVKKGWTQNEPTLGYIMKEYLVIPETALKEKKTARAVLAESFEYVFKLAPKKRIGKSMKKS
jgi:hypothetical protein